MNIFGLLSFYDEPPLLLAGAITSWARTGITHLIAVDGAYALLPDGHAASPADQHNTILQTARACGLGLTLHIPTHRWLGNEIDKRTTMFRIAETHAQPQDWYAVIDADEHVTTPLELQLELALIDQDVAEVTIWEHADPPTIEHTPTHQTTTRRLFRAIPGLRVVGSHYNYLTPDGQRLWGKHGLVQAADLTMLRIEHRQRDRPRQRAARQRDYYQTRDRAGIEAIPA